MPGNEYECKDCGRAFLVDEEEKKKTKCPSCESENLAMKKPMPLPSWVTKRPGST